MVHGPLQATLLFHFAAEIRGALPARFDFRSLSPLFDDDPVVLHAKENSDRADAVDGPGERPGGDDGGGRLGLSLPQSGSSRSGGCGSIDRHLQTIRAVTGAEEEGDNVRHRRQYDRHPEDHRCLCSSSPTGFRRRRILPRRRPAEPRDRAGGPAPRQCRRAEAGGRSPRPTSPRPSSASPSRPWRWAGSGSPRWPT